MVRCGELFGSASKKILFIAVAALATFAFAQSAAASTDAILKDCNDDGALSGKYSKSQLQNALGSIPSDLAQYSDCESVIKQALLAQLTKPSKGGGGGGGGNGGGADALISKAQKRAIKRKVAKDSTIADSGKLPAPVGTAIEQSGGQTLASSAAPNVPTALIVAAIGMFMLFAVELAGRARKRRLRNKP